METRAAGDRRHASTVEVVALVTLIIQVAAIVWGAARLNASVDGLTASMDQVNVEIRTFRGEIGSMKVDLEVLKSKVR